MDVFIHNFKCCGHSIRAWIKQNDIPVHCDDCLEKHTIPTLMKDYDNVDFSFSVVRNTYDRTASNYLFEIRYAQKMYKMYGNQSHSVIKQLIKCRTFTEWFNYRLETYPKVLMLQKETIAGVDYVMEYEDITSQFKLIQQKYNCYDELPILNKYSDREEKLNVLSDSRVIEIIQKHYKEDIDYFEHDNIYS